MSFMFGKKKERKVEIDERSGEKTRLDGKKERKRCRRNEVEEVEMKNEEAKEKGRNKKKYIPKVLPLQTLTSFLSPDSIDDGKHFVVVDGDDYHRCEVVKEEENIVCPANDYNLSLLEGKREEREDAKQWEKREKEKKRKGRENWSKEGAKRMGGKKRR